MAKIKENNIEEEEIENLLSKDERLMLKDKFYNSDEVNEILKYKFPRWNELPTIELYNDQVVGYIQEMLENLYMNYEEKILTKTMINNYVKSKTIPAPKNKKYNRKHIAYLYVLCLLKQVFSITEITKMISCQINTRKVEEAYDSFCEEMEQAIAVHFRYNSEKKRKEENGGFERYLLVGAVESIVGKIHTCMILKFLSTIKEEVGEKNKI